MSFAVVVCHAMRGSARSAACVAVLMTPLLVTPVVLADYEAPLPAYAPGNYYNSINPASPGTLKSQLLTRLNDGFSSQSYSSMSDRWQYIDTDPGNSNNVLEIYTRKSTSASSGTLNTEHQWVDSRLPSGTPNGDYFNLRPANSTVNSQRSNYNFTATPTSDGTAGIVKINNVNYWFPGHADKGDVARSLFYMATKYSSQLTLVNGAPMTSGVNQMGDLASLLKFHYTDGVDNFERKRNVAVQGYQNNRNPYVDHPEYVWAVFGGGNNDSQLSVGTPDAAGASSANVNLGTVIKGATLGSGSVTLSKAGANPTTLDITAAGLATTTAAGAGQVIDYGTQSRTIGVGLTGGTATPGYKSGTVTIDNTDLTTGGTGRGSADGNDVVNVFANVLDYSNASFSSTADINSATIDLGTFDQSTGSQTLTLVNAIFNHSTTAGYTAGLDLDSILGTGGDLSKMSLSGAFTNLAEGAAAALTATIALTDLGDFSTTYRLGFSDQNIAGARAANSEFLILTLTGSVVSVPEPGALVVISIAGLTLLRRRR